MMNTFEIPMIRHHHCYSLQEHHERPCDCRSPYVVPNDEERYHSQIPSLIRNGDQAQHDVSWAGEPCVCEGFVPLLQRCKGTQMKNWRAKNEFFFMSNTGRCTNHVAGKAPTHGPSHLPVVHQHRGANYERPSTCEQQGNGATGQRAPIPIVHRISSQRGGCQKERPRMDAKSDETLSTEGKFP